MPTRKIIVLSFVSLDGVMQAPGGPEEDPSGGFKYGGWTVPYFDEFLGQVMTANDADFSVFWARGGSQTTIPTGSTLFVGKHVGEDGDTTRTNETIGYVVIESGSGTLSGIEYTAGVGSDSIRGVGNSPPYNYSFAGVNSPGVAVASSAAMDGGDGGFPILYGSNPVTSNALQLAIDEDGVSNSERSHTTEQVAFIVFGTAANGQDPGGPPDDPPDDDGGGRRRGRSADADALPLAQTSFAAPADNAPAVSGPTQAATLLPATKDAVFLDASALRAASACGLRPTFILTRGIPASTQPASWCCSCLIE